MPQVGNIIEAVAKGTYLGIPWNSTQGYICTAASSASDALDDIALGVFAYYANWSAFAIDSWKLTEVTMTNLSNTAEIGVCLGNVTGALPGSQGYTPSGINAYFKLIRTTVNTRNGIRYMTGLSEAQVSGNDFVGNVTGVKAWATWYTASISGGANGSYDPVIIRKKTATNPMAYNPVKGVVFRGLTVMNRRMK